MGPGEAGLLRPFPSALERSRSEALPVRFFRWILTHRFTAQLDPVRAMNDAVQYSFGNRGIPNLTVPLGRRHLRGQHQRPHLAAILADFPEIAGFAFTERRHPPSHRSPAHFDLAQRRYVLEASKLHRDDIPVPVLAPGNGQRKTGRLWTYVRDDRSAGDAAAPAVWFAYSQDRRGRTSATLKQFYGNPAGRWLCGFSTALGRWPDSGGRTPGACIADCEPSLDTHRQDVWDRKGDSRPFTG